MALGAFFLTWGRPSSDQHKSFLSNPSSFNYDPQFVAASQQSDQQQVQDDLSKHGFFINRARILLGSGAGTFNLAASALRCWSHFQLDWAFVDPQTPLKPGTRFCVSVKELLPLWISMPLQIAYVSNAPRKNKGSFGFGSGTLHGHLLAGEESFSIEWDMNDQVWYEIFSFSKPANLLSSIAYPYVQLRQKFFAQQSSQALLKHVNAQQAKVLTQENSKDF
ncbi:UPF0548 protein At2g17695 [Dioscorea cayenensis subsp. rotundata]|uniref:UPF0548 protein At2g17695 n=1 Tax=Dioscorea cayennensis subsp. rotundata TaxID=55577 RepID=A0AB40C0B4_DIOCR|nr:UPF0548 protein At2g17695 [Dioscorea cayenensis subsp. rotundata]